MASMAESGESRFAVLAEMFRGLEAWWCDQGVPTPLATEIDQLLRSRLSLVLDSNGLPGLRLAEELRREIEAHELPVVEWFRRGYVRGAVAL